MTDDRQAIPDHVDLDPNDAIVTIAVGGGEAQLMGTDGVKVAQLVILYLATEGGTEFRGFVGEEDLDQVIETLQRAKRASTLRKLTKVTEDAGFHAAEQKMTTKNMTLNPGSVRGTSGVPNPMEGRHDDDGNAGEGPAHREEDQEHG